MNLNLYQKELSRVIGLNEKTLQRWRLNYGMPYLKHPTSNRIYFDEEDTLKFVASKQPKYLKWFEMAFTRMRDLK